MSCDHDEAVRGGAAGPARGPAIRLRMLIGSELYQPRMTLTHPDRAKTQPRLSLGLAGEGHSFPGLVLDARGIVSPAAVGEVLGMPAVEAQGLLTRRQWREGDMDRLRAAAR